jgi:RNA polymerase sigma factor for flagellar operon FliA
MISNEDLWNQFIASRSPELREKVILQYAPLVKFVINGMSMTLPAITDQEDLIGYGTIGLVNAVDRYDPSRGVKFETYAIQRIRGAIIDSLRELNILSRLTASRLREIEHAIDVLTQEMGRYPSEQEIADYLGQSVAEVEHTLATGSISFTSLDASVDSDVDDGMSLKDMLTDSESPDPDDLYRRKELRAALVKAIQELPERSKLVISLYYIEEASPLEIAEILGISRSRVYQLHAKAILRLRALLRQYTADPVAQPKAGKLVGAAR